MSKRYIGLDIQNGNLQVAIAEADKKQVRLQPPISRPLPDRAELPGLLTEILGPGAGLGDRLIVALPTRPCYLRWLDFPFRDAKKLTSAVELELSVQLPVDIEDYQLVHRSLDDPEHPGRIVAAAVPNRLIEETLALFDEESWPAHLVELAPFALAAGLTGTRDGDLLVIADDQETVVCTLQRRMIIDTALLPAAAEQSAAEVAGFVERQVRMRLGAGDPAQQRVWLIAPRHPEELHRSLQQLGVQVAVPSLPGQPAEPGNPALKAALLALSAAGQEKRQGLNLRRGPYALRGEWQKLRRSFIAVAVLAVLLFGSLGATAWLKHADLQQEADRLAGQMEEIFRQTFSSREPIVDIPRQIEARLVEMRNKTELLGLSSRHSALRVLEELSERLPEELQIEIREFNYATDNLRLGGFTGSFDAVNQAADRLGASPLFADVQITDAKMSLDGTRVDFQLQLDFGNGRQP